MVAKIQQFYCSKETKRIVYQSLINRYILDSTGLVSIKNN